MKLSNRNSLVLGAALTVLMSGHGQAQSTIDFSTQVPGDGVTYVSTDSLVSLTMDVTSFGANGSPAGSPGGTSPVSFQSGGVFGTTDFQVDGVDPDPGNPFEMFLNFATPVDIGSFALTGNPLQNNNYRIEFTGAEGVVFIPGISTGYTLASSGNVFDFTSGGWGSQLNGVWDVSGFITSIRITGTQAADLSASPFFGGSFQNWTPDGIRFSFPEGFTTVPEPSGALLTALVGCLALARRRRRRSA